MVTLRVFNVLTFLLVTRLDGAARIGPLRAPKCFF